ncbi:MAG: outer membrane beta-barrel protein [Bacteroidota bacterium]|nr:outer membrane beta-barrel protein [Bacteroidota bacterium]
MFEREPNIDIVFRNGLKNLEVLPPADVWDSIPPMPVKHTRLRVISGIAAGVAALVSLTLLATWYVRNNSTPVTLAEVAVPGSSSDVSLDIAGANPVTRTGEARVVDFVPAVSSGEPAVEGEASISSDEPAGLLASSDIQSPREEPGEPVQLFPDEITVITAGRFSGTTENLKTPLAEPVSGKAAQRLIIGASLSPAMGFSRSGQDTRLAELINSEKSRPAYSTGVSVGYRISDRLTIQSGIGLASIGQTISDVAVYAGLSDYYAVKSNYLYSVETASGLILAGNTDLYLTDSKDRVGTLVQGNMADPSKYPLTQVGSDIRQVFRYLELPVMVRYKLIDKRVGLNLSGGMAYGFLVDNAAYTGEGSDIVRVGYTEGMNTFNLSSQLGLGMEYNISQKITFNLEPVFRYYVTPLSDISGALYKPYSVGFSSGFFFKF